jgi:hypothetical protein
MDYYEIQNLAREAIKTIEAQMGKTVDMKNSSLGKIVTEDMEPLSDYCPLPANEAQVHAFIISGFITAWNAQTTRLFRYKHHGMHRKVFTDASVQKLRDSTSVDQLSDSIEGLETIDQIDGSTSEQEPPNRPGTSRNQNRINDIMVKTKRIKAIRECKEKIAETVVDPVNMELSDEE